MNKINFAIALALTFIMEKYPMTVAAKAISIR